MKLYVVALEMADRMEPGSEEQRRCRELALERLEAAIREEALLRAQCRDTSVAAATRIRAW